MIAEIGNYELEQENPKSKIERPVGDRREKIRTFGEQWSPIINNRNSRKSKQRNGREEIKEQEPKDMNFNGKTH